MASQTPYYAHTSSPVVVQGHVIEPENKATIPVVSSSPEGGGGEYTKGERQPKRCNDVFFALLFYAQLGVMAWLAFYYTPQMYDVVAEGYGGARRFLGEEDGGNGEDEQLEAPDPGAVLVVVASCFAIAFGISGLAMIFMMAFSEGLIKMALWFNIILSFLIAVLALLSGAIPLAILCFLGFALTAYYAYVVWSRIPFAAANLVTALTAVKANMGLWFFAFSSLAVLFGWILWWTAATTATVFVTSGCNANGECESATNGGIIFALLVSLYWTIQVVKNTVHVTCAGTVGTWWFTPSEANSCCSRAVRDSFVRAITFSFGSICFGSLIVAIIQAAKEMVRNMRENGDSILMCCAECILGCIEWLVEYFNKWAFCYVGLYGYSFMTAGTNVMTLFRSRGWTTIITDNLIDNVLTMVSGGVGLLTGVIGLAVAAAMGLQEYAGGGFVIGLILGFVVCGTLMSVVSSAVNTVIVCYAEAPNEFQVNHPQLSERMRETWRQAWPVEFQY